jgi:hypothetical protein
MKRKSLITLVLGTALALAPAANAAVMQDGGGSAVSPSVVVHTDVLGGDGTPAPPSMSKAEYRALVIRGEALNERYGAGGVSIRPDILGGDGGPSATEIPTTTGGDSFVYDAALGGAALIGAMLLVLAFAATTRRKQRLGF